jgi:hypothetical protein
MAKKETNEPKYTREVLIKSNKFSHIQKDFLSAILTDDFYTMKQAEQKINKFLGGAK